MGLIVASWAVSCAGDVDPGSCERLTAIADNMATHSDLMVAIGAVVALPVAFALLIVFSGRRR